MYVQPTLKGCRRKVDRATAMCGLTPELTGDRRTGPQRSEGPSLGGNLLRFS
jgi:hypothetical protein